MTIFEMLEEFHRTYGLAINEPPHEQLRELRASLINEETEEVLNELLFDSPDVDLPYSPKALTKELADLIYVSVGTATSLGLPLEAVLEETHKSNMSKLGEDGKPIYRADGKVLKGPNYKEPNLDQFFQ